MEYDQRVTILPSADTRVGSASPLLGAVDLAIDAWLNEKEGRSHSQRTRKTYDHIISTFRDVVLDTGYDLFADVGFIATLAQGFAQRRTPHPRRRTTPTMPLAATSYNHTLAVLSSFYAYALNHGFCEGSNPIGRVERRPVSSYASAKALEEQRVAEALEAIGSDRLKDLRDFALLAIAFSTGRRAQELAQMTIGSLSYQTVKTARKTGVAQRGPTRLALTVAFRAKGGKDLTDALEPDIALALEEYLTLLYGENWSQLSSETPVWVNCSRNPKIRGQQLRPIGIAYIFKERLGEDAHPHQARHSFTVTMDEANAPLSEIQRRLGHSNIATTSLYMGRLRTEENPYGADVVRRLGLRRSTLHPSPKLPTEAPDAEG